MDISTIILIIFILAGIGFIDGIIERKAPPYIYLGIIIFFVFITNGLTRLIVIIYASKKAYEIFGEPNK
jgi:hypothetical protein